MDFVFLVKKEMGVEVNEIVVDGLEGIVICKVLEEKESVLRILLRD